MTRSPIELSWTAKNFLVVCMYTVFIKAILWQHSERVRAGSRGDDLHAGIVDIHVCLVDIDHIFFA